MELPQQFVSGNRRAPRKRPMVLLAIGLALVCGWQVFGLPGSWIDKYQPPPDMPWVGHGFRNVFITADGTWGINRFLYADRMQYYELSPTNALSASSEYSDKLSPADISGIPHGGSTMFSDGTLVNIKPGKDILRWLRQFAGRDQADTARLPSQVTPDASQAGSRSANHQLDMRLAQRRLTDWRRALELEQNESRFLSQVDQVVASRYGSILFNYVVHGQSASQLEVLRGHHYLSFVDSYAVVEPDIWLTSDRLRWLHHLRIERREAGVIVRQVASIPLDAEVYLSDRNCLVGLDPIREKVFLVRATGDRTWFEPDSLEELGSDVLPGNWDTEFASLNPFGGTHSAYRGLPLTRQEYNWLMRGLMIGFMGSLLWLLIQWRQAWKYILEPTTAAADSKSALAHTSAQKDTA